MGGARAVTNPLSRFALESPPMLGVALSIGARLAGAALSFYIANDQAYDRTQVFATGVGAFAMISIVPAPRPARPWIEALAAGVLFFAGAALLDQAAGIGILAAGAVAVSGTMIANHRAEGAAWSPIVAFYAALPLTVASMAALALAVEG